MNDTYKKYWDKNPIYLRILEILDDYWIYQKDEERVDVEMRFYHKNGERQIKHLVWTNPTVKRKGPEGLIKSADVHPHIVDLADVPMRIPALSSSIEYYEYISEKNKWYEPEDAAYYQQIADWLKELKKYKEEQK